MNPWHFLYSGGTVSEYRQSFIWFPLLICINFCYPISLSISVFRLVPTWASKKSVLVARKRGLLYTHWYLLSTSISLFLGSSSDIYFFWFFFFSHLNITSFLAVDCVLSLTLDFFFHRHKEHPSNIISRINCKIWAIFFIDLHIGTSFFIYVRYTSHRCGYTSFFGSEIPYLTRIECSAIFHLLLSFYFPYITQAPKATRISPCLQYYSTHSLYSALQLSYFTKLFWSRVISPTWSNI